MAYTPTATAATAAIFRKAERHSWVRSGAAIECITLLPGSSGWKWHRTRAPVNRERSRSSAADPGWGSWKRRSSCFPRSRQVARERIEKRALPRAVADRGPQTEVAIEPVVAELSRAARSRGAGVVLTDA